MHVGYILLNCDLGAEEYILEELKRIHEVKIPDPLKRQVGQRRFGSHRHDNRSKYGRSYGGKHRSARDQYARGKKSDNRHKKGHSYYGLRSRWWAN